VFRNKNRKLTDMLKHVTGKEDFISHVRAILKRKETTKYS